MEKKKTLLLAVLLLGLGIGILAYPTVSNWVNQRNGSYAIQELQQQIGQAEEEEIAEQLRLVREYNAELRNGNIPENYGEILDFSGGMMGYIRIPKIGVNLPIYHGVSDEVLAKGVGHMPQSAFPIGGEGNHSVLTGHTGLPSAELFTKLTDLSEGDVFYIHILDQVIAYQVDQISMVVPDEVQGLSGTDGKDYCTLVTCTPYGVNSHRLLVRGERMEASQEETEVLREYEEEKKSAEWIPLILSILALILMGGIWILLRRRKR